MSHRVFLALFVLLLTAAAGRAEPLPIVSNVAAQPLKSQAGRIAQALEFLGQPLTPRQQQSLQQAIAEPDEAKAIRSIQQILDPLCLAAVTISPESRVKVMHGEAKADLTEQGWTVFLLKVNNKAGVTAPLRVTSPNAAPLVKRSTGSPDPEPAITPAEIPNRWLDIDTYDRQPLTGKLSGLEVDYRIVQLYSRNAGKREATLAFDVGQGTQDLGFRNELAVLFEAAPAVQVTLEVIDHDGKPTTAWFVFRDEQGRVYPARSRRLEPDFFFHDQIYRHHDETVTLPPGKYEVEYSRGPEYHIDHATIDVPDEKTHRAAFRLRRWIKLADHHWYSGDHHVHAAGCAHYESPTEGVTPEAMMRHILGEDLNVGCVLSWGPCWYHQKQFFEGEISPLSTPRYLMRYDVEVSGFPSSHAGHLCLLRLTEDDFPGTTRIEQWPSWDLPVLQWGKQQGGVVGFSHSGWGLQVASNELPNYDMPPFDGIGANEYIVDVTHDAVDFISAVDTPSVYELNIWYHTLNCGFTTRISGETDFPCIYGERVGLGRAYVKLPEGTPLTYDNWVFGIRDGRSYCSDGLSHLFDFQINGLGVGEKQGDAPASLLSVERGETLSISASAAGMLGETPNEAIRGRPQNQKPYWHIERCRLGDSREVPVELIVNGRAVERKAITADGSVSELKFDYIPARSCWVALRILPSSHTNPIFVEVDGQPIRASRKSAQWCREAVDVCWEQKSRRTRDEDKEAARAAYDHARKTFDKIISESPADR